MTEHDDRRASALAILDRRAKSLRARAERSGPDRRAAMLRAADQLGRLAHLLAEGAEDTSHAEAWIEATEHI